MADNVHICKYKTRTVVLYTPADTRVIASWLIRIVFIGIHECFAAITVSVALIKGISFRILLTEMVTKTAV